MQYGKLFGNWKIRNFIGEGSQGKTGVFRIIKSYEDFQEENALKVVTVIREDGWPEEVTDEVRREYAANKAALCDQAVNEVKLMNRLAGNPYVVSYLNWEFCDWEESGQFGCDLLIQMPLLLTLRRLQKTEERFSEEEIRRVGRDICKALILCGKENIIHRDIKPANIFLWPNRRGNYMLGDFGISRIVENGLGGTYTSVGTPDYAAPEQFAKQSDHRYARYDSRVDIYSLGLTLYELANQNRLPFLELGRSKGWAANQRASGIALPQPSQASHELAQIILKACAFRPEERYQTAEEFLAALENTKPQTIPPAKKSSPAWIAAPVEELSRLAQQGDAPAQYNLGMCYYVGRGVPKSHETALSWFHKAAAQGHAHAMAYIGLCYQVGLGVECNLQEAFDWTCRAAEHGDPVSMRNLGRHYLRGKMIPQDLEAAIQWFRKSVDLDCPEGMIDLAQCYWDGQGVEQDLAEAERLLQRAADKGNTDAIERLQRLHDSRKGFRLSNVKVPPELSRLGPWGQPRP